MRGSWPYAASVAERHNGWATSFQHGPSSGLAATAKYAEIHNALRSCRLNSESLWVKVFSHTFAEIADQLDLSINTVKASYTVHLENLKDNLR